MNNMKHKEIGGYIEFEKNHGLLFHEGGIALNSGRACLEYLIRAREIRNIWIPWFMCDCIGDLCARLGINLRFYHVNELLRPVLDSIEEDEWMYIANYYGQISDDEIVLYKEKYHRVIVDQAQAYFQMPVPGIDTLYTCRKFLGVADGAFLYTNAPQLKELPVDESYDRMRFLMGRFERTASEFYQEYAQNNDRFANEPLKRMSKLTENLLRGIDYAEIKRVRTENYRYLYQRLERWNVLKLQEIDGAFAYPLLLENGAMIRKELLRYKIYIPTLWPNVLTDKGPDSWERHLAQDVLPLPCDQRYTIEDMEWMCDLIEHILKDGHGKEI